MGYKCVYVLDACFACMWWYGAVTFEDLTSDHDKNVHIGFPVVQSEAMGRYLRWESVQHGDQILRLSPAAEGQCPLPGS